MSKKKLLWQLYPSYLLITLLSLLAITWYTSSSLRQFYLQQITSDLKTSAYLLQNHFSERINLKKTKPIDSLCKKLGKEISTRITIVLPSGHVVGDSRGDPQQMDNHADRPEIKKAFTGQTGNSVRFSHTLQRDMMYVAIPMKTKGEITGVLRVSISLISIDRTLESIYKKIVLGGIIAALLAAIISFLVSQRISHPLEKLKNGAKRFARGDLKHKMPIPDTLEIGAVTESMNQMATQLDERIHTVVRQRNEQEAILASMVEGVLAIDSEEHLISLNQAAADLVGIDPKESQGRSIQEIVRNVDLQRFVKSALSSQDIIEGEIIFNDTAEKFLQAHGTILSDEQGKKIGAVVVLNDVTRLKKLENIRRDFVANVSHELKTPITAIKGFVETLIDGAKNNPEDLSRFLAIIATQSGRLNAIIEDLLALSRIEQGTEKAEISLEKGKICDVIHAAILSCDVKAKKKKIKVDLNCPDNFAADINAPLLEQAVINLIDNAIKYSEPESTVHISSIRSKAEAVIEVCDQGCGIDKEHLPRLFERFYRIDKARSRELGGTGLGLAIVKHIAQAHNGHVCVESTLGKGSIFSIHLPL